MFVAGFGWVCALVALACVPDVQVRLYCVRMGAAISKKAKELSHQDASGELIAYDSLGEVSRADRLGNWLGNTFCYALHQQGPFCAALLMQVCIHVSLAMSGGIPMLCHMMTVSVAWPSCLMHVQEATVSSTPVSHSLQ